MRGILADNNINGHVRLLVRLLESKTWSGIWSHLNLSLYTFKVLGLLPSVCDRTLWEICQREEVVLITSNRNADGPDSLEVTLRTQNAPDSLPVFTLANPDQILYSRSYAERVAESLLDHLLYIDVYRGAGRLYLP